MKTTFITTVLNEHDAIEVFLSSLLEQSLLPGEIIIVDGGSTDDTLKKIELFRNDAKKKQVAFQVLSKNGNRSVGRNYAISRAKGNIILCSDVGCILKKDWVASIVDPFTDKDIDVVAGYYYATTKNVFEACLATYTCVMPDKVDPPNFLPSSRSIAFRKSSWDNVGGYPEYLDTCEDLVFARKMKESGCVFKFQKDAIVFWPQRKNLVEAIKQFYSYAVGDGMAHYIRPQIPLLFLRYIIGVLFLIISYFYLGTTGYVIIICLLLLYLVWAIHKNYHYVKRFKALFWLPVLQITADITVMTGFVIGLCRRNVVNNR